jgi:23S rRNA (adenine2503-C2)-methyltransferase
MVKPILLDQNKEKLREWLTSQGEAEYRSDQILTWVHRLQPIQEMSDLPAPLRNRLAETFEEGYLALDKQVPSGEEGVDRFLFRLADGEAVEAVRIGETEDYTACISTQVGCGLRCAFCASGKFGLERNLSVGEILGQVYGIRRAVADKTGKDGWPRHLVYMGMGEPFQNYRNTLDSIRRLIDPQGPNFGARRITVSTVGMAPEIYRFARENLQVTLAVSLHAPNSDLRRSIMPVEEVYPLATLLRACEYYIEKTSRRLTFEYVLLKGINDTPREAKKLVETFKTWKLVHFNLIRYNPIGLTKMRTPKLQEAQAFLNRLREGGLNATLRKSPGKQIDAACGQLRGLEYEKAGVRPRAAAEEEEE